MVSVSRASWLAGALVDVWVPIDFEFVRLVACVVSVDCRGPEQQLDVERNSVVRYVYRGLGDRARGGWNGSRESCRLVAGDQNSFGPRHTCCRML